MLVLAYCSDDKLLVTTGDVLRFDLSDHKPPHMSQRLNLHEVSREPADSVHSFLTRACNSTCLSKNYLPQRFTTPFFWSAATSVHENCTLGFACRLCYLDLHDISASWVPRRWYPHQLLFYVQKLYERDKGFLEGITMRCRCQYNHLWCHGWRRLLRIQMQIEGMWSTRLEAHQR